MKKWSLLPLISFLIITLLSCNKTETEPNPREAALGKYTYTAKTYVLESSGENPLTYRGSDYDLTGTFIISASSTNIDGIVVDEDGNKLFGDHIGIEQGGFSFEIDPQAFTPDDVPYIISGYQGVTLTSAEGVSKKYDGGYFTDTKKMQFYFQATSQDEILVFEYNLTRSM